MIISKTVSATIVGKHNVLPDTKEDKVPVDSVVEVATTIPMSDPKVDK